MAGPPRRQTQRECFYDVSIKTILAPKANRADIEEDVPESVKTGIRFLCVEDVKEVLAEVFNGCRTPA